MSQKRGAKVDTFTLLIINKNDCIPTCKQLTMAAESNSNVKEIYSREIYS